MLISDSHHHISGSALHHHHHHHRVSSSTPYSSLHLLLISILTVRPRADHLPIPSPSRSTADPIGPSPSPTATPQTNDPQIILILGTWSAASLHCPLRSSRFVLRTGLDIGSVPYHYLDPGRLSSFLSLLTPGYLSFYPPSSEVVRPEWLPLSLCSRPRRLAPPLLLPLFNNLPHQTTNSCDLGSNLHRSKLNPRQPHRHSRPPPPLVPYRVCFPCLVGMGPVVTPVSAEKAAVP